MQVRSILIVSAVVALSGCVSSGKYDEAVRDATSARADRDRVATERKELDARVARLSDELHVLTERAAERDAALVSAGKRGDDLQKSLDEATTMNEQMRAELARLGKDADRLLKEKGALASSLTEARARLDELRRAQSAAEARAKLYQELALKLKKMLDAGDLTITLRDGRMVLLLPNDVLFDTGRTEIKPAGKAALEQVAAVMKTIGGRDFQVAGHTDTVPIATARFPSNWELSTARALAVVHVLVAQGVRPEVLSAAGYGEFDPVASNDTNDGKRKNRRTEISLVPNIDEMVAVPR
ncbi:MAG: OmpA family protein [Myxococcales bacterium]|nr:OmpA family protein [Myxococcales bacterium]